MEDASEVRLDELQRERLGRLRAELESAKLRLELAQQAAAVAERALTVAVREAAAQHGLEGQASIDLDTGRIFKDNNPS